jgi:hypothetical protein
MLHQIKIKSNEIGLSGQAIVLQSELLRLSKKIIRNLKKKNYIFILMSLKYYTVSFQ